MTTAWIIAVCILWVLVLLIAYVVLGALRRVTAALEQVEERLGQEGPQFGAAPTTIVAPFELYDEGGNVVTSDQLLAEPSTIILFVEPNCKPCLRLLDQLDGVGDRLETIPFRIVVSESREARRLTLPPGLQLLYQTGGAVTAVFSNRVTPQAYAVGRDRFVLDRRLPTSENDLREMARVQRDGGGEARGVDHHDSHSNEQFLTLGR